MRVLVASDAQAGLSGFDASEVVAQAFVEQGAEVAVVPLATSGPGLIEALERAAPGERVVRVTRVLEALEELRTPADALVLDATAVAFDVEELTSAGGIDELSEVWRGKRVVLLAEPGAAGATLTGLGGVAAESGRRGGRDLASVLQDDDRIGQWAARQGVANAAGAGAAGGLGALVQRLGGHVTDPLTHLGERFGLAATMSSADLVVTGAETLDFHARGGPVVTYVVELAGSALRPVIAIVGRNFISARELRLAGMESAYPASLEGTHDADSLAATAARVARTWTW